MWTYVPTWWTPACAATFEASSESSYMLTTPKHPLDARTVGTNCLASSVDPRLMFLEPEHAQDHIVWINVENSELFEAVEIFELEN
ncbi:hypothetical protein L917_01877 [Phytophthora nicotianae]|uniref:Uncharacterized protein n=1 Tax=Phytophthora nicotianae TaxID=4792 RepID=W2LY36_PHYNI|nr:hypothetical protein L917_01877 [Phytophthora nicotianae]